MQSKGEKLDRAMLHGVGQYELRDVIPDIGGCIGVTGHFWKCSTRPMGVSAYCLARLLQYPGLDLSE